MVKWGNQTYYFTMMKKILFLFHLVLVIFPSLPAQSEPPLPLPLVDPVTEIILLDLEERVIPELKAAKLSFTLFGSVESVVGLGLAGAGAVGIGLSAQLMFFPPLGIGGLLIAGTAAGAGAVILGDGWRNLAFGMGQLPPLPEPAGLIQFRKTLSQEIRDYASKKAWLGVGLIYVSLGLGAMAIFDRDGFNKDLALVALGGFAGGLTILVWSSPLETIWNAHVSRFPLRPEEMPEEEKSLLQP